MRKVIVDIYGGDNGPEVVIKGALEVLKERSDLILIFAGDKELVENIASSMNVDLDRVEFLNTDKFISNHDNPRMVFNGFNDTSLVMAYEKAKTDETVDGVLSCGSTGAVVIGSIFRLGLLEGISAPSLGACLKSFSDKPVLLMDCGANVDIKPDSLVKFAKYGTAFMKSCAGIESPRIGLLNVGKEDSKGNLLTKEGYKLLKDSGLNFVGNIEGSDIFNDECDVCVCDGFSGNVVLKLAESIGLNCAHKLDDGELKTELLNRYAYNDLGCSILVGTKKIVAKAHGKANEITIKQSLLQVLSLADGNFVSNLKQQI